MILFIMVLDLGTWDRRFRFLIGDLMSSYLRYAIVCGDMFYAIVYSVNLTCPNVVWMASKRWALRGTHFLEMFNDGMC